MSTKLCLHNRFLPSGREIDVVSTFLSRGFSNVVVVLVDEDTYEVWVDGCSYAIQIDQTEAERKSLLEKPGSNKKEINEKYDRLVDELKAKHKASSVKFWVV
jgi:hypothetical protein